MVTLRMGPLNAQSPMVVTLLGMTMLFMLVVLNAPSPMVVTLLPMVTLVRFLS
jgi:hypothetical protein